MNEIISIAILLSEVLMVLQCLQIAFKKEIQFDKYTIGIILIDVIMYLLINMGILPAICSLILYLLLFVFYYIEFKQTISKTIVRFIIGFVLIGSIQSLVAFITNFFRNANNSRDVLLISSFAAFLIAYLVRKCLVLVKLKESRKYSINVNALMLLLGASVVVLLIDYYFIQKRVNIYVVVVLFFLVLILFYLYRLELARNEIEKKNYELELQRVYGGAYSDLIANVRRRQHDFKNQLGAIYSMHLVAKSLDELICMQKEYGDSVCYDSKFDSILTTCNNSILAGYLYHRCVECEQNNILVHYNIHIDQAECCFCLHEVIEVFGILIDNACESFDANPIEYKQIKVECLENKEDIIICVSNPSNYIAYSEIEKMFAVGFSTKGENRGIGLSRVLELTQKYNAVLRVSNTTYENENWIEFLVKIEK